MQILPDSFWIFYKEYLGEHRNHLNRIFHHIGTMLAMLLALIALVTGQIQFLIFAFLIGYGLAWAGHYYIEKNKPTSFQRPLYSFIADFVMLYDLFTFELDKKIRDL